VEVPLPGVAPLGLRQGRLGSHRAGIDAQPGLGERRDGDPDLGQGRLLIGQGRPDHDLVAADLGAFLGRLTRVGQEGGDLVDVTGGGRDDDLDPLESFGHGRLHAAGAGRAEASLALHLAAQPLARLAGLPLLLHRGLLVEAAALQLLQDALLGHLLLEDLHGLLEAVADLDFDRLTERAFHRGAKGYPIAWPIASWIRPGRRPPWASAATSIPGAEPRRRTLASPGPKTARARGAPGRGRERHTARAASGRGWPSTPRARLTPCACRTA
jgi:hypothetical protein